MITDLCNDNSVTPAFGSGQECEPHGRVAMLVAESLIHGLIARSVLSVADAIEILDIAADVLEETGIDRGDSAETMSKSLAILDAISASLAIDMPPASG